MIKLSIVVCTHNRAESLKETLECLTTQTLDRESYEVIVVNNRSSDSTPTVVRQIIDENRGCRMRLVDENRLGLSHARNRGIAEANGEFVGYIDDDASADPDWAATAIACFEGVKPQPWALAGPIAPVFDDGVPKWFNVGIETWNYGDRPSFVASHVNPIGANMVFRKSVLVELGGFDPEFSLCGSRMMLGDEVDFVYRLRQAKGENGTVYYHHRLAVKHHVSGYRTRVGYVLKRRFENGQADCLRLMRRARLRKLTAISRAGKYLAWHAVSCVLTAPRYGSVNRWATDRVGMLTYHYGFLRAACGRRVEFDHRA